VQIRTQRRGPIDHVPSGAVTGVHSIPGHGPSRAFAIGRYFCRDIEREEVPMNQATWPDPAMAGGIHDVASGLLPASEDAYFRSIFHYAAIGIALVDMEGHPVRVNPALERLLGYSADELAGMVFTDFTHPEDVGADWDLFGELIEGRRDHYQMEKRYVRADGELIWGHLTVSLIRDEDGRPAHAIGMVKDITERVDANRALREAETRYRTLIEQVPAVTYIWDFRGGFDQATVPYVSPQIEQVLGFAPEAFMADANFWFERTHDEDRHGVMAETLRSVNAGEPFHMEYRMIARNGSTVWVRDDATAILQEDSGRVLVHQGILVDITEAVRMRAELRSRLEELRHLDEERRSLLARLVLAQEEERRRIASNIHDDPLQKITAAAMRLDMLVADQPALAKDEKIDRLVDSLRVSIASLRHLMFEVQPYSLERDGDLDLALRTLTELEASADQATRYELEWNARSTLPSETATVLYRIAQEAVVNARKHAGATHVTISVVDRGQSVCLRIDDDGVGFSSEFLGGSPPGHLGLTAMRERAEMVGGTFAIRSTPGTGTSVEVRLPVNGAATRAVRSPER
jgi:PAS domain S-box-containing protein